MQVQKQTWTGPSGPGAAKANWDSAILELHENERFILELWTFRESYRLPNPENATGELDSFNQPRASERWLDEVRATLKGSFSTTEVPGVRLVGFSRPEANQDFVEDPTRLIDGLPTWWSADGLHFFYFARAYNHWKLNALRTVGGDGLAAICIGGRKAGCGYAHSGPSSSEAGAEAAVLRSRESWFEAVNNEWEAIVPEVHGIVVQRIDFRAETLEVDERTIRGKESSSEQHRGGPLSFNGWLHAVPSNDKLRVMLPRVLQTHPEGGIEVAAFAFEVPSTTQVGNEPGYRGDLDVLVLEPARKARL
jgi:hypothetical protein